MKNLKVKIAILSQSFIVMGILIVSTVLANIGRAFPEAGLTAIQMVMTFGMIASFPATLIAGALGAKIQKKKIVLFALIIMLLGGLLPIFLHTKIWYIYLSSLLIGCGQGLLMTTVSNLSTDLFIGEERSEMYGLQAAFQNGGSVVLMLLAGWIARNNWSNAYLAFLLIVPVILIVLFWLPKDTKNQKTENVEVTDNEAKVPLKVLLIGLLVCLFCIGYATFSLNASLYIADMKLGDSTTAALAMSLSTGAGVLGGFIFKYIFKSLQRHVLFIACIVTILGYLSLVLYPSLLTVFIAAIFSGIGFSLAIPIGTQAISETATPAQMSNAMGSYMAFTSVGAAISPLIINALAQLSPNQSERTVFLTSVIFLSVLAVVVLLWSFKTNLKGDDKASEQLEV
ncbi:MFS transporter [Vagococcus sp. DIV0080]|uniref:MFS transporter n=1 Tax=Candidatus Vagococcus giribetii TaxID=2230876 RepID=A0ABS3HUK7_9ENTE|nr:MFS transporter [Vagococcus sp. DIV0080]MBO0477417.1 MFS transporter [Vagococcus sp. DIV0080]